MIRYSDLHACVVKSVDALMTARGWAADPESSVALNSDIVGDFTRPLGDGFIGRIGFPLESEYHGEIRNGEMTEPPSLSLSVEISLSYQPGDRLLWSLHDGLSSICVIDLRRELGSDVAVTPPLSELDAVEEAARQLIETTVDRYAIAFLQEHANVDRFMTLYREGLL